MDEQGLQYLRSECSDGVEQRQDYVGMKAVVVRTLYVRERILSCIPVTAVVCITTVSSTMPQYTFKPTTLSQIAFINGMLWYQTLPHLFRPPDSSR